MTTFRTFVLLLLLTMIWTAQAYSQITITTGPVTTAHKLAWAAPTNVTTEALVYVVYVDNAPLSAPLPGAGVLCSGSPLACTATLPAELVTKLNVVGAHNLELVAIHATGGESPRSLPFVLKAPPAAPTGVRLTQ